MCGLGASRGRLPVRLNADRGTQPGHCRGRYPKPPRPSRGRLARPSQRSKPALGKTGSQINEVIFAGVRRWREFAGGYCSFAAAHLFPRHNAGTAPRVTLSASATTPLRVVESTPSNGTRLYRMAHFAASARNDPKPRPFPFVEGRLIATPLLARAPGTFFQRGQF
jgi:hypothetical protein